MIEKSIRIEVSAPNVCSGRLADGFITLKHYDDYLGAGDFIKLYLGNEKIGFDLLDFVSAVNELLDKNHKLEMIDNSVTGESGPKGVV